MKVKTEMETKAEFANCIAWAGIWLMMLYAMTGCTLHIGVDWNGETKKDNRTYSDKAVK